MRSDKISFEQKLKENAPEDETPFDNTFVAINTELDHLEPFYEEFDDHMNKYEGMRNQMSNYIESNLTDVKKLQISPKRFYKAIGKNYGLKDGHKIQKILLRQKKLNNFFVNQFDVKKKMHLD